MVIRKPWPVVKLMIVSCGPEGRIKICCSVVILSVGYCCSFKVLAVLVLQVNAALSKLANAADDAKRKQVLKELRSNCSPMNLKWIARVRRGIFFFALREYSSTLFGVQPGYKSTKHCVGFCRRTVTREESMAAHWLLIILPLKRW